jgi:AcrR family transcriptional regulator
MPIETTPRSGIRMSADERRHDVLMAAVVEFAKTGYAGTSTEQIAARAGISQPYLFRLFKTKKALFLAAINLGFDRIEENFARAADGLEGAAALAAMGDSYFAYLEHTDLLLLQLHAYAASGDPEIKREMGQRFDALATYVAQRSGISEIELGKFFSTGMLLNVAAALGLKRFSDLCAEMTLVNES